MSDLQVLMALWVVWLASWGLAALWASRAATRPPAREEGLYRVLTIAGTVLIFWGARQDRLPGGMLWTPPPALGWAVVGLAAIGFGLTWWARIHLGALWSGSITRKPDHRIVDTGPYGLVRHPIYSGLLLALVAAVIDLGSLWALAGAAVLALGFYSKARLEERFLGSELGAEAYAAYRRRVPMLVPFLPRRD